VTRYVLDNAGDLGTARADFYSAIEVLVPVEMHSHQLNEEIKPIWRDDGGQMLYIQERIAELMGGEYRLKDTTGE